MYKLNSKSQAYIKEAVGLPFDTILEMNSSEVDSQIEKNKKIRLAHKPLKAFRSGRGTPFFYLWRFLGLRSINRRLAKI